MSDWPRLTESLPTVDWSHCQNCDRPGKWVARPGDTDDLRIWMEHDQRDVVESRAVVLCGKCSDAIIGEHPRLYRHEGPDVPCPGVMTLCRDCVFRRGYLCAHSDLTLNGGPGLAITSPQPVTALVNRGRSGGGCGHVRLWSGTPRDCAGRST